MSGLTKASGGGGALIDVGSHLIDQLRLLVPGDLRVVSYADNARGGIETDCEARFEIASRWGRIPVRMELSRTRELRGTVRVECERATLELARGDFCRRGVLPAIREATDPLIGTRSFTLMAEWEGAGSLVGYKAFREEFDDWLRAIRSGEPPVLSGRSVVPVVRAIEECYAVRSALSEPWTDGGLDVPALTPTGAPALGGSKPTVLVTGAGGFVGCRTVELLHATGRWDVRPMVRRPASAARLARLPLDVVLGDVESADDMRRAVAGCEAIVHCAVGTTWPPETAFKTTVHGTRTLAEAASAAGVRRFVHLSSMAVHGERVPPRLDGTGPAGIRARGSTTAVRSTWPSRP